MFRHPEVAATRPSKDVGPGRRPSRRACDAHLRVTAADIPHFALYIPLARPRPGFWRFAHDPERENNFPKRSCAKMDCTETMTERSSAGLDERRRRLLFRAWRRGVREMDLIVGRFADVYIDQFDEPTLDDFERLIEVPNADLYAWIVGYETVPTNHDTIVLRQLIAFHNRTGADQ
jgi:antitoxin CptB